VRSRNVKIGLIAGLVALALVLGFRNSLWGGSERADAKEVVAGEQVVQELARQQPARPEPTAVERGVAPGSGRAMRGR
jgi:hypothetical protein